MVATGVGLPLRDGAVEAALSIDSIEHVPAELRALAIGELMRVATRRVVISIPCGAAALDADARLIAWHRARYGDREFWLSEHLQCGLPTENFMLDTIDGCARALRKTAPVRVLEHMPMLVHDLNHRVVIVANYALARVLSWGLWMMYPQLRRLSRRAYYRRFFVVNLEPAVDA